MATEPRYLGHYQMLECVARGGMGEVWKALDTRLQRTVAIKLLLSNWRGSSDFVTRFQSEARLIASLRHPNIVNIHNFYIEEREGEPPFLYMVMDYVEGQTLAAYIADTSKQGKFPPAEEIVDIFTAVSQALDYAHGRGMIHRDIKPANILLDQRDTRVRSMGEPIITDFGIARRQGVSGGTLIGSIVGTPLYVAPEQALGMYEDKRSDLYSLGIILYEVMTGTPPFHGASMMNVIMQHVSQPPVQPELLNTRISPAVSEVILKSIAKKPEERFASASAMTVALAQAFQIAPPASLLQSMHTSPPDAALSLSYIHSMQTVQSPGQPDPPVLSLSDLAVSPSPSIVGYAGIKEPMSETDADMATVASLRSGGITPVSLPGSAPGPIPAPPPQPHSQVQRRWLLIGSIVLLVVALVVGSLFFVTTQSQTFQPAGTIHFSRGPAAKYYNTLQIDAEHIPAPPAGKAYYAWIDPVTSEEHLVHWKLTVKDQQIHSGPLSDAATANLLLPDNRFLITLEDATNPQVLVPAMDPRLRLYYAKIPLTHAPLVYTMKVCPADANSSVCF
ncbi:hypothetical protein KDW_12520 [Dictyobacter vulcani]|uniref:non-specific serine/threonine protein kinase n=1 Tax=Dictyobacter vulcani TaxID=2607529 RepID=A0A5J4KL02_9CHLR|nr:serine/threonine-protein kinase [Dictyobacter vulcani]GER87090.1 hypothetical protein KDW_12520 [Dictyobacter vulcani]